MRNSDVGRNVDLDFFWSGCGGKDVGFAPFVRDTVLDTSVFALNRIFHERGRRARLIVEKHKSIIKGKIRQAVFPLLAFGSNDRTTGRSRRLERRNQSSATSSQVAVIGIRAPCVSGPFSIGRDRKFPFALRTVRHVVGQCSDLPHHDRSRGSSDDPAAVIGFVIDSYDTSSVMFHHVSVLLGEP